MIPQEIKDAGLQNVYKLLLVFITCMILFLIGLLSAMFLGNDNIIEQEAEGLIFQNTGYMIDLTPEGK